MRVSVKSLGLKGRRLRERPCVEVVGGMVAGSGLRLGFIVVRGDFRGGGNSDHDDLAARRSPEVAGLLCGSSCRPHLSPVGRHADQPNPTDIVMWVFMSTNSYMSTRRRPEVCSVLVDMTTHTLVDNRMRMRLPTFSRRLPGRLIERDKTTSYSSTLYQSSFERGQSTLERGWRRLQRYLALKNFNPPRNTIGP
jgi:hypothetical protein